MTKIKDYLTSNCVHTQKYINIDVEIVLYSYLTERQRAFLRNKYKKIQFEGEMPLLSFINKSNGLTFTRNRTELIEDLRRWFEGEHAEPCESCEVEETPAEEVWDLNEREKKFLNKLFELALVKTGKLLLNPELSLLNITLEEIKEYFGNDQFPVYRDYTDELWEKRKEELSALADYFEE